METSRCYRYYLVMKNGEIDSIELEGQVVNAFKKPVTDKGVPKLYVVKHQSKVIYVGHTTQGLRTCLRQGFQAKGEHGYYGYQWKNLSGVDLLVWCFRRESVKRIESIEAELVYLVRRHKGQWPEYQTEIHFHEVSDSEKEVARSIYQVVK